MASVARRARQTRQWQSEAAESIEKYNPNIPPSAKNSRLVRSSMRSAPKVAAIGKRCSKCLRPFYSGDVVLERDKMLFHAGRCIRVERVLQPSPPKRVYPTSQTRTKNGIPILRADVLGVTFQSASRQAQLPQKHEIYDYASGRYVQDPNYTKDGAEKS